MDAAKETIKTNGKGKVSPKKAPAKPVEKPGKETAWSIARTMLTAGKGEKEIKAAVLEHLLKTINKEEAFEQFCARLAYRSLYRAKRQAKKGDKNHASK